MVTIEQKISLFSKLLHRSMSEKFAEEMEKLKKEYIVKLQKNKEDTNKEAAVLIARAEKKAEAERFELMSKARISIKKEYLSLKEKYFNIFMEHLRDEIGIMVKTERYGTYLLSLVKKLKEADMLSENLVIYMTERDIQSFGDNVKNELLKYGLNGVSFRSAGEHIIGGLIAEDPVNNIRTNLSIQALLEDNKAVIMQSLFKALEAGEVYGI